MHFVKLLLILNVLIFNSIVFVESFKYLFIFPSSVKSHFIFGSPLAKALANKGHEVYVISAYPEKQPIANYYDISVDITDKRMRKDFTDYVKPLDNSEAILQDPTVQLLIRSNHNFDAVICEASFSDALFGFSEHFKAPLILLSAIGSIPWNSDMIGSPSPPSYVPFSLSTFTDRMSFSERLVNLFLIAREINIFHSKLLPKQVALYNKYFPHLKKDLFTVRKNAAAILLNTHVSLRYPRPYMPNQIEVGGMHIIRQQQPLPGDIEQFIQEAEHGVLYFSMGSFLKGTDLPDSVTHQFVKAFKVIKQNVLWKMEEPRIMGRHKNVYISDWFPQDDILAHENVKAIISHGGMLSITESIYHGKPIIGIPIFFDQFSNMANVEHQGIGIKLDLTTLTAAQLVKAIKRITHDKKYTERIKAVSARFKDQPIAPLDLAVYWAEHVARHKGTQYMRCAGLDLSFIEYHNIDAMLLLYGGSLSLVCSVIYYLRILTKTALKKLLSHKIRRRMKRMRKVEWWLRLPGVILRQTKSFTGDLLEAILPDALLDFLYGVYEFLFGKKTPRRLPNSFKLRQSR